MGVWDVGVVDTSFLTQSATLVAVSRHSRMLFSSLPAGLGGQLGLSGQRPPMGAPGGGGSLKGLGAQG